MAMHDDGEKLFSKNVRVFLKDYDQKTSLDIAIYYKTHAPGHRRELYICLTNADDLLFLQTLTLSEDDFQSLKHQQGLLVDYGAFPQKFIDLLELCIKDQCSSSPRFMLHLTTGSLSSSHGLLEVVETNPFKHLVHLVLTFVPGNDEEVKHYLAGCLKSITDEKELIQKRLRETEEDLTKKFSDSQFTLNEKITEIESSKMQWQEKLMKVEEKCQVELKKERDKSLQLSQTYEIRLQNESRVSSERFNQTVGDLETKLNVTLASNKALSDQKYKYETLIRDLKCQLATLEEERQVKSKDVDKLRLQNHHLDSDRHERDKTLNHLKTRVAVFEQEVKNKDHVIEKTNQLMDSTNEQKHHIEVELEKRKSQIMQLEGSVNSVSSEVIKGNEIINKLQMEIKALKSRVKMMGIVTMKQEKLIEEKEISITNLNAEKSSNQEIIMKLHEKISQLNVTIEESSQKLVDTQETLKNNENVINWLNKQLNEYTMSHLSQNTITRNNSNAGGNNGRVPLGDRTPNNANILPRNRHSTLDYSNNPRLNNGVNINKAKDIQTRTVGQMPYDGNMFGKPCFQNENISPIVSHSPCQPLSDKQQNSNPVIIEGNEPILDAKYLMRRRIEIGKKEEISGTNRSDENAESHVQTASNTAKPYIIPSSYFPLK